MPVSHSAQYEPTRVDVWTVLKELPHRVQELLKHHESSRELGFEVLEQELHALFTHAECAATSEAPTGLPTIAGTAQVGETLTASSADIADADGFANATFAWQWIANDGTADADITGATGTSYTLTAAEVGKTVKARVVFTDDGGTEETLVSEASAAVAAALPVVSVGVAAPPVTEGAAVEFTLSRTGDAASALTVAVSVSEDGAVLSGTPASAVTFGAGMRLPSGWFALRRARRRRRSPWAC